MIFILYYFQTLQSQDLIDYTLVIGVGIELFWSFALVYSVCELGHRIANEYDEIDYEIGQFDWYSFPVDLWPMLPTLIIGVQQPVGIDVFGIVSCSREDFKKVNLNSNQLKLQCFLKKLLLFCRLSTKCIRILC